MNKPLPYSYSPRFRQWRVIFIEPTTKTQHEIARFTNRECAQNEAYRLNGLYLRKLKKTIIL